MRSTRAGRSGRTAPRPSSASIRTSRSRPARAASSSRTRRRSGGCSSASATRAVRTRGRLVPPRAGSASTTAWTDIQAAIGVAQLEKLDEILALRRGGRRALRRSCWRTRRRRAAAGGRRRSPRARGSSTSFGSSRASIASGVMEALRAERHRDGRVRPVRPPPAVHARAVRLPEGHCSPCRRRRQPPHARAAVLHGIDESRPGARRGRAAPRTGIIGAWLKARPGWSSSASASTRAPTRSTRSSRSTRRSAAPGGARASGSRASPSRSSPRAPSARSSTTWATTSRRRRP